MLCPFRLTTGGYCPACGMTRAVGHLVRGEVSASVAAHPYVVLAVVQLVAAVVLWAAWRHRPDRRRAAWDRWGRLAVGLNLALLMGVWAVRLALGLIPAPFTG